LLAFARDSQEMQLDHSSATSPRMKISLPIDPTNRLTTKTNGSPTHHLNQNKLERKKIAQKGAWLTTTVSNYSLTTIYI
jgi:hypothetical protein